MKNTKQLIQIGQAFFTKCEFDTALKFYSYSLRIHDKNSDSQEDKIEAIFKIAKCYYNLNMYEDALNFCNMLLKLDPQHKVTIRIKAMTMAFLGEDIEEILELLEDIDCEENDIKFVQGVED